MLPTSGLGDKRARGSNLLEAGGVVEAHAAFAILSRYFQIEACPQVSEPLPEPVLAGINFHAAGGAGGSYGAQVEPGQ